MGLRRCALGKRRPRDLVVARRSAGAAFHQDRVAALVVARPGRLASPGLAAGTRMGVQGRRAVNSSSARCSSARSLNGTRGAPDNRADAAAVSRLERRWARRPLGRGGTGAACLSRRSDRSLAALGEFHPPEEHFGTQFPAGYPNVDFDGDGIGDALLGSVRTPVSSTGQTEGPGSYTALARSGRDGHVIWKTVLDPREGWFEPARGHTYGLRAFPLPRGDFNGDGTPDVVVQKHSLNLPWRNDRQAATLPVQLLSGRSGRLLWSAGALPLGFEAQGYSEIHWAEAHAVEPGGAPDLLVRHGSPFTKTGSKPALAGAPRTPSLARVSGRDGRILWNIAVAQLPENVISTHVPWPAFADFDGDGSLDTAFVLPPSPYEGRPDYELLAFALRDGTRLWSRPVAFRPNSYIRVRTCDLDGDKLAELIVTGETTHGSNLNLVTSALNGRDGKDRWTCEHGDAASGGASPWSLSVLTAPDKDKTQRLCISFNVNTITRRIVILDENGHELARREVAATSHSAVRAADLDGDGRDEILLSYDARLPRVAARPVRSVVVARQVRGDRSGSTGIARFFRRGDHLPGGRSRWVDGCAPMGGPNAAQPFAASLPAQVTGSGAIDAPAASDCRGPGFKRLPRGLADDTRGKARSASRRAGAAMAHP